MTSIPSRIIYRSPEQVALDAVAPYIPQPPAACGLCRFHDGDCALILYRDPHPRLRASSDTCVMQTRYEAVMHLLLETDPDAAMEEGLKRLGEVDG